MKRFFKLLISVLASIGFLLGCSVTREQSSKSQPPKLLSWSSNFNTEMLSGSKLKTLDFRITEEMAGGKASWPVYVKMTTGAWSLIGCDLLWSIPSYDQIYTILLRLDGGDRRNFNFRSLGEYLDTSRIHGLASVLDVSYYTPSIKNTSGERWPLCQNGRIRMDRVSEHWLVPGTYRIVLSSYRDFCTEVRLSCKPANSVSSVHIEVSDEMEMRERYKNNELTDYSY